MILFQKSIQFCLIFVLIQISTKSFGQINGDILRRHNVTLPEAHKGDLETDTRLLDSYGMLPENYRQFYLKSRAVLAESADAGFVHPQIIEAAEEYDMPLMGGAMLGRLKADGVTLWLRPSTNAPVTVRFKQLNGNHEKNEITRQVNPGVELRISTSGLIPDTAYEYEVTAAGRTIAGGRFKTAPVSNEKSIVKLAFGSCFHKIGLHNQNLVNQILKREPHVLMLLGDIAVDDRENSINMHRADYLLRDVSLAWRNLAANVPVYAVWDDHDYLNNDLSGIPKGFTKADREALRMVWRQNWNNPENEAEGIFFNTRIGPAELIMLDTRSCRTVEERGKYGSYLGPAQQDWLLETLKKSTAPVKIITSGTMWSDYVTKGKDSWGTWDTLAREEIFSLIEKERIAGVLLISGDRHGARGFRIPRSSEFSFYEFEPASLGGVPGPDAIAGDADTQLFGYHGSDVIAFGEFSVDTQGAEPVVTFRLIDDSGKILEEHVLPYSKLTP